MPLTLLRNDEQLPSMPFCSPSMPFWRASWCQQSIVYVRIKILPHGILCLYQITAKSILVFVCAIFGIVSLENFYVLLTLERVSPPIEYWLMLVP
ncbi:hypothetical protein T02_13564, partial [Trichinella nativa]